MPRPKKIYACDAETDPFLHGRIPFPFIWGLYDGKKFSTFDKTEDFVNVVSKLDIILYAHNGGKFDFMYLLPFIKQTKAQIINGRIVSMFLGNCELRDSFSIIPEPLRNFGDKREIDYSKLEASVRDQHKEEIHEYLFYDCKILYDAVSQYRKIAGTKRTIASNALAYSKKPAKLTPDLIKNTAPSTMADELNASNREPTETLKSSIFTPLIRLP